MKLDINSIDCEALDRSPLIAKTKRALHHAYCINVIEYDITQIMNYYKL